MKLNLSNTFSKRAKKLLQKNSSLKERYADLLATLSDNIFDPALRTHKLKGELEGLYACSLTHDLRIIFELSNDTIHLIDIGSHDEVY